MAACRRPRRGPIRDPYKLGRQAAGASRTTQAFEVAVARVGFDKGYLTMGRNSFDDALDARRLPPSATVKHPRSPPLKEAGEYHQRFVQAPLHPTRACTHKKRPQEASPETAWIDETPIYQNPSLCWLGRARLGLGIPKAALLFASFLGLLLFTVFLGESRNSERKARWWPGENGNQFLSLMARMNMRVGSTFLKLLLVGFSERATAINS